MDSGVQVKLTITNLLEEEAVETTKNEISQVMAERAEENPKDINNVIILLCGGDGTFMNMAQELNNYGIEVDSLKFVVFPFGTANDIARSFGWGSTPSNTMLQHLFVVCDKILKAKEETFDVWEIEIITNAEYGDIQKADGRGLASIGETTMKKYMCHSFSFGSDARTGLSFERRRTRNRFCNRFRYAYEGLKNVVRCWGEPTMKIKDLMKR